MRDISSRGSLVPGSGFRVPGAGCRVPGSVQGSGFGSGFRVLGSTTVTQFNPKHHSTPVYGRTLVKFGPLEAPEPGTPNRTRNPEPNPEPGTRHPEPTKSSPSVERP